MGVKELSIDVILCVVMWIWSSKLFNLVELGNVGSFFKNLVVLVKIVQVLMGYYLDVLNYLQYDGMVKLVVGWLIEKVGWKGFWEGDVGVYDKQVFVIVNFGFVMGLELFELLGRIIVDVCEKFGVMLEWEVNIF